MFRAQPTRYSTMPARKSPKTVPAPASPRPKDVPVKATRLACLIVLAVIAAAAIALVGWLFVAPGSQSNLAVSAASANGDAARVSETAAGERDAQGTPVAVSELADASAASTSDDAATSVPSIAWDASPTLPDPASADTQPDNDVDAETGEAVPSSTAGNAADAASGTTSTSSDLPAPLDPSAVPDNDVVLE